MSLTNTGIHGRNKTSQKPTFHGKVNKLLSLYSVIFPDFHAIFKKLRSRVVLKHFIFMIHVSSSDHFFVHRVTELPDFVWWTVPRNGTFLSSVTKEQKEVAVQLYPHREYFLMWCPTVLSSTWRVSYEIVSEKRPLFYNICNRLVDRMDYFRILVWN